MVKLKQAGLDYYDDEPHDKSWAISSYHDVVAACARLNFFSGNFQVCSAVMVLRDLIAAEIVSVAVVRILSTATMNNQVQTSFVSVNHDSYFLLKFVYFLLTLIRCPNILSYSYGLLYVHMCAYSYVHICRYVCSSHKVVFVAI